MLVRERRRKGHSNSLQILNINVGYKTTVLLHSTYLIPVLSKNVYVENIFNTDEFTSVEIWKPLTNNTEIIKKKTNKNADKYLSQLV